MKYKHHIIFLGGLEMEAARQPGLTYDWIPHCWIFINQGSRCLGAGSAESRGCCLQWLLSRTHQLQLNFRGMYYCPSLLHRCAHWSVLLTSVGMHLYTPLEGFLRDTEFSNMQVYCFTKNTMVKKFSQAFFEEFCFSDVTIETLN